jgi:hypothetical protein
MCLFPLCKRHGEKNGYCVSHQIYSNSVEVKMPKEPNKESDKMKDIKKELKKQYPVFLKVHPFCEVKLSPACTKNSTCIHHKKGRGKDEVLNQSTWAASCTECNRWVEENHAKAQIAGMKISRHKKAS